MADHNTNNEEKTPLNEAAVEPDLDTKAQFVNGGKVEPHVAIECGSGDDVSFTGLGKEELMQYADDPFWKRVRLILLIVFWAGWIAMLVAAIVIIVLAPRCPYRPDQKWYDKEIVYEILPESFQDSSPKSDGAQKEGNGYGDINEGRPTEAHPYPELYRYNNYKRPQETRGTSSIEKRSTCITSEATPTKYESLPRPKTTGFLVHDENEGKQPFPFPVEREITVQSLMTAEQIAAPHDHDYCSVGNEVVHSSDVQCQTDLTLHDLEKSEAELLQLRDTFKNKDDLRRYMTVDKMTNSDSSVMSYFGLPSVLTLFGIFAILDKITPTLAYDIGKVDQPFLIQQPRILPKSLAQIGS